jgi:hydroxymethylpyrimidine/phosphomethylpyrimidine kinase
MEMPVALTIAGSDPSGGAGIQADLKTFHQFGVYGMAAVTLLTVQNTRGVKRVTVLDPRQVREQVEAVLADIAPGAAKTGALGNVEVIQSIAKMAGHFRFPLVVDTVMVSKHGAMLMDRNAFDVLKKKLLPRAFLVTPNLFEAEVLTGLKITNLKMMERAARHIAEYGPHAVLIKGGHLKGAAADLLYTHGTADVFSRRRIKTFHTHGTGCTYSAAITACLAQGKSLTAAVKLAKNYITNAIQTAPHFGKGTGPVNHHAKMFG